MTEKWAKAEIIARKVIIIAVLAGASFGVFLLIPKILGFLLPFVIAYVISLVASPMTKLFNKLHIPPSIGSIISILVVAAALFGMSALVISKLIGELYDFSSSLPSIYRSMVITLSNLKVAAFNLIPDSLMPHLSTVMESLDSSLNTVSANIIGVISSSTFDFIKNVPRILITIVFSILASYFLIRDKKKVKKAIATLLGPDISSKISHLKKDLSSAVFAYLRAQCILMSITFVELFVGLMILNVNYSFLFALIIAFVDAIPVFGTGAVLLPWALYCLITGKYSMTIGLCILYAVCLIVRQLLEPKILATQIGMHPLLTIFSMYIGYRSIGIFGMILGPVVTLIVKKFAERYLEQKVRSETVGKNT